MICLHAASRSPLLRFYAILQSVVLRFYAVLQSTVLRFYAILQSVVLRFYAVLQSTVLRFYAGSQSVVLRFIAVSQSPVLHFHAAVLSAAFPRSNAVWCFAYGSLHPLETLFSSRSSFVCFSFRRYVLVPVAAFSGFCLYSRQECPRRPISTRYLQ